MADAADGLKHLVSELNRKRGKKWAASAIELRGIVKQWQDSGPNLWKLFGANPGLWAETQSAFRPSLVPTKSGNANMRLLDNAGAPGVMVSLGKIGIRFYAVVLFNALTLNPQWRKLAGPCPRCGNYYINKKASHKVYCSRTCGKYVTAIRSSKKSRDEAHKRRIDWANEGIADWLLRSRCEGWKSWVVQYVNRQESKWAKKRKNTPDLVTQKSLTRWVNAREIQQPLPDRKGKKQ